MELMGNVALVVIAIVYVGLAIGALVGFFMLIKIYKELKQSVDEIKKDIEPYKVKTQDVVYKVQQTMDILVDIASDAKELSSQTKETATGLLDTTKKTADEMSGFVINTKNKTEKHINYLFNRIEMIEEKMDNMYAIFSGFAVLTSKLKRKGE